MKIPSIPLTIVYKIVQVDSRGRMFSANPHAKIVVHNWKTDDEIVQYKLRHQVFPNDRTPVLFACGSLDAARRALQFYGARKKCYILRGYAANVRKFRDNDPALGGKMTHPPVGCFTVLCDWFIPIGIVDKNNNAPIDAPWEELLKKH